MSLARFSWRGAFGSLVVLCACAWPPSPAAAEFGPIQLVSKSSKEQAGFAREPTLSGDGKFVAFIGELGGHTGLFRKDLSTGALTLVVERHRFEEVLVGPSISAEGRYIAFTTTQTLDPLADTEAESQDVYLADLATSPPTYELVSSVDGHAMSGASFAAPRVAISAAGTEVAFVNAGEVYVHFRGVQPPTLITVKEGTAEPVAGGGAFQNAGAALSADGNAIAWVGEHLPEQVPLLPDERARIESIDNSSKYQEPLWRLVPTTVDPRPPTRRIVGGGDPSAPGCPAWGTLADALCRGPFPALDENHQWGIYNETGDSPIGTGWGINLPELSADGARVVVIGSPEEITDLFVVDMSPGLSRVEAVRQLTKWINAAPSSRKPEASLEGEFFPYSAPILGSAISPDGSYIAFASQRQHFEVGATLATPRPSTPSIVPELYQVNLALGTIERVTPGVGAGISIAPSGSPELGAKDPSYSADGRFLAFGDAAYNLIGGDANEASDVFMVESTPPGPIEPTKISPPPSQISVIPSWRLSAHAVSRPNGAVRVVATVPGAGTLWVSAKSPLGSHLRSRVVDTARRRAGAGGTMRLDLKLPKRKRKLAHRRGGLYTWLKVRFAGPGGVPLQQQFAARFRAHKPKSAKKGKP